MAIGDDTNEDPRRRDYIERIVALGEEILRSQELPLLHFEEDFVANPDRFRCELLGRTALDRMRLTAAQIRQLDILGTEPDLMTPLQQLRKETSHTRALAWALSPRHRSLGHGPLEALLRRVDQMRSENGNEEPLPELWTLRELACAKVRAERYLPGYGRADISIELPRAFLLIELKIDAQERPDQITDYHAAAVASSERATQTPVVVLLTADTEAVASRPTCHLSFEQLLRDLLPVAASMDTPDHHYLAAYLASIARVIDIGATGTFDDWDFARRRRAINFIRTRDFE